LNDSDFGCITITDLVLIILSGSGGLELPDSTITTPTGGTLTTQAGRSSQSEVSGAYEHAQGGSHVQLKHATKPGRVTIPVHAGETLQPFIVSSILKQAGLTAEDLHNLL